MHHNRQPVPHDLVLCHSCHCICRICITGRKGDLLILPPKLDLERLLLEEIFILMGLPMCSQLFGMLYLMDCSGKLFTVAYMDILIKLLYHGQSHRTLNSTYTRHCTPYYHKYASSPLAAVMKTKSNFHFSYN